MFSKVTAAIDLTSENNIIGTSIAVLVTRDTQVIVSSSRSALIPYTGKSFKYFIFVQYLYSYSLFKFTYTHIWGLLRNKRGDKDIN